MDDTEIMQPPIVFITVMFVNQLIIRNSVVVSDHDHMSLVIV